jgi:hypothetical protein
MKPPSGGPAKGPTNAGMVSSAIAETSSLFFVVRTSTRRPTGVIIAPPMPCRKRATTNSIRPDEIAQKMEPTTKTQMARRKMRLAPNLSAIHPLIGMKTASDTM